MIATEHQDGFEAFLRLMLAAGLPAASGRTGVAMGTLGFASETILNAIHGALSRHLDGSSRLDIVSARRPAGHGLHEGFQRLLVAGDRISLTFLTGPAEDALAELEARVDAWLLGPADPLPAFQLARLSRPGALVASVAGHRAALEAAGFRTEPVGDLLRARFEGPAPPASRRPWFAPPRPLAPGRALVLGGGIAGACVARALLRRGWSVLIAERRGGLASEGSGNPAGIVMPRLVLGQGPERRFHAQAFLHARGGLSASLAFRPSGVLDLGGDPRLAGAGILPGLRSVDAGEASDLAGAPLPGGGLWLPDAGWLEPAAEAARLAEGAVLLAGKEVRSLTRTDGAWLARDGGGVPVAEAELVVLAGGLDCRMIPQAEWLPLIPRRGQVTLLAETASSARLRCVLNGEAYLIPALDGVHVTGATFDPVADSVPAAPPAAAVGDDARNLAALDAMVPGLFPAPEVLGRRAGLRATTADHLPLVGPLPDRAAWIRDYAALRTGNPRAAHPPPTLHEGLFVLTGLGARGLTTAPLSAELLASQVMGEPWPVPRSVADALHPGRTIVRDLRTRRA